MNKKLILAVLFSCFLAVLPLTCVNAAGSWSYLDLEFTNDFYAVWGTAADDVYAMGTLGINIHYDGNAEGTWETKDKKSG